MACDVALEATHRPVLVQLDDEEITVQERRHVFRILRQVMALKSGVTLLQVSGCTIDETLLTDLTNLAVNVVMSRE